MARVGKELAKMEKARGGGDQRSEQRRTTGITAIPVIAEPMTLEELGISKREASHAQKIASIPRAPRIIAPLTDVCESRS